MTELMPDAIPEPPAADQPDHSGGTMIALKVPDPHQYAVPDGTSPDDLHVTLVYLGNANELSPEQKQSVVQAAQEAAARFGRPPQAMFPYDYSTFPSDDPEGRPFVLHPYGDDLDELYGHVCNALKEHGLGDKIAANHDFNPHVTLKYLQGDEQAPHPDYTPPDMDEISFPQMRVSIGDQEHPIALTPTADRPIRPQSVLASVEERLHNLVADHNLTASRGHRASLPMIKAVYSREFQDTASSPARSLTASALRRAEGFLSALAQRDATHQDADLFPPASPTSPFERTLTASVTTGSDRIKALLMESAISCSHEERAFNLGRALHAASVSPSPHVQLDLTEPLRVLLADGNSSAARSLRAKLQLRDRHGRWIEMGRGVRFKVHAPGAPGSGTWYHGIVEGTDVPNGNVSVRLEDGRLVQVPANKLEQPIAIIGLQGEHLNRTPDAQLDATAPAVPSLNEISAPVNAQDPIGAGDIRALLDRLQTRMHDGFRDNRDQEKGPVQRMMQAVGQATRDLQNPNTQALDQAASWIDQFMRDNPNLSSYSRNNLLYAQDTFRNLVPVLQGYQHDSRNFTPQHKVQRAEGDRPRPFRRFRNGRAEDNQQVNPVQAEIPAAGERVTVPSLEAPQFTKPAGGGFPARPIVGDELRRYLADDYGVNSSFLPGPDGRPDSGHMSISGDKAHVQAALHDIWGLTRDDSGNIGPIPNPSADPSHGDTGALPSIEAAINVVENAHPGLAHMGESLQRELDQLGSNPNPQQWQELSDTLDGARQVIALMVLQADGSYQENLRQAHRALDEAATNAWQQARPDANGNIGSPQAASPINATQDHVNRAISDQLHNALEAVGDMEDANVPGINLDNVRDQLNDVIDSHQNGGYPAAELEHALNDIMGQVHQDLVDAGMVPEHDFNGDQQGAYDRFRGQIGQAAQIANGDIQVPGGAPAPAEANPQTRDQFGNDVPTGFTFDQEILNQGARVQLYNHVGSDGRQYQVGVRPQRFGGRPAYVVRVGSTHNGRQHWSVLNQQPDWAGVGDYFQQVEVNNEEHRQGEVARARIQQEQVDAVQRHVDAHGQRVAENLDDRNQPLPAGWTRHLDDQNNTFYQDGQGNVVMSTGEPDHALALYGRDPVAGGRSRIGIFDNWGTALTALSAHTRDKQALTRSNIVAAAEHQNLNLSAAEQQAILNAPDQAAVRSVLEANAGYQAMRARAADAQQADRMQPRDREAYQVDNQFQALVRKVADMPSAPEPSSPDSPAPQGPTDEAHRLLPEDWVKLPSDDNAVGQMYMGPAGATAYVDTNRPGNPITVGFENAAGEAHQVTGLPDWNAVSELVTQVERGIIPSNAQQLPNAGPWREGPAVDDHNARAVNDQATGFRDSLQQNLLQIGVNPNTAAEIMSMPNAQDVRDFVGGLPEVRNLLAGVAEQDSGSVAPIDQRNANLINRGLARLQDLPDGSGSVEVPMGNQSRAEMQVADGLESFLQQIEIPQNQINDILDDPTAAIDKIEAHSFVQNLRANAGVGNERAIPIVQQLDQHEQALREALAGGQPSVPPSPGPPEGNPGNPNDVRDSGAPPQGAPLDFQFPDNAPNHPDDQGVAIAPEDQAQAQPRVGAPAGQETRYHPDGVIQDRAGNQIARGARVVSRRDGANVIGVVVAVQQQPPYARIQWPDGRRQVRAGNRLLAVERLQVPGYNAPEANGAIPRDRAGAPIAPQAPAAPAAPALPQGNAEEQVAAIADMHVQGANRAFPLLPEIGNARTNINSAMQRIQTGDRAGAANQISAAMNQYRAGIASARFANESQAYKADVNQRLVLAQALYRNLMDDNFPLKAPNATEALNGVVSIRNAIPRRVGAGGDRGFRNAGFALDDALPLIRNGNLGEAEAAMNRAIWLLRQGNHGSEADALQGHLNTLRAANLRPENAPAPDVPSAFGDVPEPRDFIANRFAGERAPQAGSPNTPGVVDPRDGNPGLVHPDAANPTATQANYAEWGPRAAEIAQAARVRPSITALQNAPGHDQAQLFKEAFGGLDGITFGKNHYSIRITGSSGIGYMSVSGVIHDSNGQRVGTINRSMTGTGGQWTAYNSSMSLNSDARSTGFANAVNRYFENWYIANGFHSVTVSAAGGGGYTGGFAWAMNGFNWKEPFGADPSSALAAITRSTRAGSPEAAVVEQLKARMEMARRTRNESLMPTPMEMALVGWAPNKTTWVGKTAMKGQSWGGRKTFQPNAINWQQRQNYEIANRASERVANNENSFNVNRPFANTIADMSAPGLREAGITPVEAEQIAKVMRSTNPSAAVLPFTTKRKLSNWANDQIRSGNYNSDMANVAITLHNELMADYPRSDNLGVAQALQGHSYQDFRGNQIPGFSVRRLGAGESGINDTFMVTHDASGETFFVKKDMGIYSRGNPRIQSTGAEAENDVNALFRQMNWPGIDAAQSHSVDGGRSDAGNADAMVIQHQVGDNLDLVRRPQAAGDIGESASNDAFRNLAVHDQLVRMLVLDGLLGNPDRHGKNFMVGQGTDGKWWLFPIDHGLARTPVDGADRVDPVEAFRASLMRGSRVHGAALKEYAEALGEVNLKNILRQVFADYRTGVSQPDIFRGQDFSRKMAENLDLMEVRIDEMVAALLGRRRR